MVNDHNPRKAADSDDNRIGPVSITETSNVPTHDTGADTVADAAAATRAADETPSATDAVDDSTPPEAAANPVPPEGDVICPAANPAPPEGDAICPAVPVRPPTFMDVLITEFQPFMSEDNIAYFLDKTAKNAHAIRIGSSKGNSIIRKRVHAENGNHVDKAALDKANSVLASEAEMSSRLFKVFTRVAPATCGGIEIDLGDPEHTRIRVTPKGVEFVTSGSEIIFQRSPIALAMPMPAENGDYARLKHYINVDDVDFVLLIGWITFTISHPKVPTSKYVILVVRGDQGSGKSTACILIVSLIDPNHVGMQVFPASAGDLSIAAQNAHLLGFDNVRSFSVTMADIVCITSAGGSITGRLLYTNSEQHVQRLHAALLFNGIHSFITQPDLAQRCLTIHTLKLPEASRKSDAAMAETWAQDWPVIFRGLLDLIASIFAHLPNVEAKYPERMIGFVRWLAAMEMATGVPPGVYQQAYSESLQQAQLDSLMENLLASTVVEFVSSLAGQKWSGTPSELLAELTSFMPKGAQYSREWPSTPNAMSKRLNALKASLATQGIEIEFGRGKLRNVTITTKNTEQEVINVTF